VLTETSNRDENLSPVYMPRHEEAFRMWKWKAAPSKHQNLVTTGLKKKLFVFESYIFW